MCLCRCLVSICVWFPVSVRALHQGAAGATAGPGTQGAGEDPASHSRPIWSGGPSQNRGGYQVKHALTCPQRSHQAGLASQTLDKQVWRPRSANRTWAPPLIARPIRLWFYADAVFCLPLLFAVGNWLRQHFPSETLREILWISVTWILKLLSHTTIPISFCFCLFVP